MPFIVFLYVQFVFLTQKFKDYSSLFAIISFSHSMRALNLNFSKFNKHQKNFLFDYVHRLFPIFFNFVNPKIVHQIGKCNNRLICFKYKLSDTKIFLILSRPSCVWDRSYGTEKLSMLFNLSLCSQKCLRR